MSEILDEKMLKAYAALVETGKKRGSVTYDEIGEKLVLACEAGAAQMDEVLRRLEEDDGIKVVREAKSVALGDAIHKELRRLIAVGTRRGSLTYEIGRAHV